jgi:antitoxin HicB
MSATRTYTIMLQPMDEGGFLVHVPALPEAVTCGDTEDEALAKDVIELCSRAGSSAGKR